MPKRLRLGDVFIDSFFQYTITMGGAAFASGLETLVGTIPIQTDADFICVHSMYTDSQIATGLAAAPAVGAMLNGGVLVKLTDGATQRDLTNLIAGVPVTSLFGSAQRPYMWPLTHLFKANTPITFQITGQGVGPPTVIGVTFRFVLGGFKIPANTLQTNQ
jgi:hypothetical protein